MYKKTILNRFKTAISGRLKRIVSVVVCNTFGHLIYFDSSNAAGPSTCKICGYKEQGIKWKHE